MAHDAGSEGVSRRLVGRAAFKAVEPPHPRWLVGSIPIHSRGTGWPTRFLLAKGSMMRRIARRTGVAAVVVLGGVLAGCASSDAGPGARGSIRWTFDDQPPGPLPRGWTTAATHPGDKPAQWAIVRDAEAASPPNVLALTHTENRGHTYNLAVADRPEFGDLELSVRVRAVSGREDQGGGPVWRYQDENNYYICRVNPLEGNFRVYVVSAGKRRQLDTAVVPLSAGCWYELRVRMVGERITCSLDGKPWLEATDATIPQAGRVGLWTKADAASVFDNLSVGPADGP